MKSLAHIIEGGGWVIVELSQKRCAKFFAILALIWLPVSIGILHEFSLEEANSLGVVGVLGGIWLAVNATFLVLAVIFAIWEKPVKVTKHLRDPNHDAHKLYSTSVRSSGSCTSRLSR